MSYGNNEFDVLSLEMQRSMDYYESHYGRGPADEMRVFQEIGEDHAFVEYARTQLPFRVEMLDLNDYISGVARIDQDDLPDYLPALGGALRAA